MKKKIIYFCAGVLLTSLILVAIQVAATAPNPGHDLTCHTVSKTGVGYVQWVGCDNGTATGGGCSVPLSVAPAIGSYPSGNGWSCLFPSSNADNSWHVVCCAVGI